MIASRRELLAVSGLREGVHMGSDASAPAMALAVALEKGEAGMTLLAAGLVWTAMFGGVSAARLAARRPADAAPPHPAVTALLLLAGTLGGSLLLRALGWVNVERSWPGGSHVISSFEFVKLTAGFAAIYLVLERTAGRTNSLFGEYGALICALVVVTTLLVERLLFGRSPRQPLVAFGLGRPRRRGLLAALLVSLALLVYLPILVLVSGQPVTLREGWLWIALGVFLQGGVAEELLWRGYLFRHLRATRGFWRAAAIAMIFMVAQHALLLWTLPLPIAIAALAVALATSFPFAHLFEVGGNTVWGVALLHCVIQGALKVVVVPETYLMQAQLGWMAVSVVVPYLVFVVRSDAATARPASEL